MYASSQGRLADMLAKITEFDHEGGKGPAILAGRLQMQSTPTGMAPVYDRRASAQYGLN